MNTMHPTVGINVSKLKLDVALLTHGEIQIKVVENDLAGFRWLRHWLTKHEISVAGLQVCMEATGPYSEAAALALTAMGMVVSDVDPERVQAFAQGAIPGDAGRDAALLARFCAATQPAPWVPPPLAYRALQAWLTQLHALRQIRRQEYQYQRGHHAAGQEALAEHVRQGIECIDGQVRQLERDIDAHLHRHPALARNVELVKRPPAGDNSSHCH